MPIEVFKEFRFEAAHFLPNVPPEHKCSRMHGHGYRVLLYLTGNLSEPEGWVMDFATIKNIFQPIRERLDHRILNDIEGLENPTVEQLAVWIWNQLHHKLPLMTKVTVYETDTSGASYCGV